MRRLAYIISLCSVLVLPLLATGSVQAAQKSNTQELSVTATILPMRHIVIDTAGRIVRITSNTRDDVQPQVYIGDDTPGNEQPINTSIMQSYRRLVPAGSQKIGVLYQRGVVTTASQQNNPMQVLLKT